MNKDNKNKPPALVEPESSKKNGHFNGSLEAGGASSQRWLGRIRAERLRINASLVARLNPRQWLQGPIGGINQILLVLASGLTLVAVVYLLFWSSSEEPLLVFRPAPEAPVQAKPSQGPADAGKHDRLFASRNFFREGEQPAGPTTVAPISAAEAPGLTARYQLVGVLMGEDPQAIIHENGTNASLFLTVGDRLDEFVVKKIAPGRVVLASEDMEVELRM